MKFIVLGVDSQTGQEMKLHLEAPNAREAHRIAHQKGIMVSKVVTVTEGSAQAPPAAQKPASAAPAGAKTAAIPIRIGTPAGPAITHFFAKVAAVTFRNFDATNRQDIIKQCRVLDSVILRQDEAAGAQEPAVNVFTSANEQIGRLGPEPSAKVSVLLKQGFRIFAFISRLSGGNILNKVRGVELVIVQARPGTPTEVIQQYIDGLRL